MKDEIERLKNKVENEEDLTFSEIYFLQTVEFLSSAFEDNTRREVNDYRWKKSLW